MERHFLDEESSARARVELRLYLRIPCSPRVHLGLDGSPTGLGNLVLQRWLAGHLHVRKLGTIRSLVNDSRRLWCLQSALHVHCLGYPKSGAVSTLEGPSRSEGRAAQRRRRGAFGAAIEC